MLEAKIEASKPPRIDVKSCQRHRNYLSILPGPCLSFQDQKMRLKCLPKVQETGFLWRNGLYQAGRFIFSNMRSLKTFHFLQKDYILAKNTDFLARSNFNSFANFDPLTTNNRALEF